jgi:hypothetical protein
MLLLVSSLAMLLCAAASCSLGRWGPLTFRWLGAVPLLIVGGCALFAVRGYTITGDSVVIHRPLWNTRLPLSGLTEARFEPKAMQGSIRTFGNGGLFAFTGFYRNNSLGNYRAYVTDPARTVVLRFMDRTVVLSPDMPEEFVRELRTSRRVA